MRTILGAVAVLFMASVAWAILPSDSVSIATANASGAGFSQIIAAQGSGVKIKVVSYEVSCSTNATGTLVSFAAADNAPADIITSTKTVPSVGLLLSPYVPNGLIVVPANKALGLNIGTANQSCGVDVQWVPSAL